MSDSSGSHSAAEPFGSATPIGPLDPTRPTSVGDGTLPWIDARADERPTALDALRDRLSPRGNVVSEASRQRTIDVFGQPLSPQEVVTTICDAVRDRGFPAVAEYATKIDRSTIDESSVRISPERIAEAVRRVDPAFRASVARIADNLTAFAQAIKQTDREFVRPDGTRLAQRLRPLSRVGVCVPGGAAAYPSTVLMTVVPAQVAGVSEIAVIAPPTPFGADNDHVLATCDLLGVTEIYRVGGAQGIAALAYGAGPIRPVDKIVGPGNLFVALAKKHVYGVCDIDSIAGPSEVVVIVDETTDPALAASDLLAQAEHDPGSAILIGWDEAALRRVMTALDEQLVSLSRAEATRRGLTLYSAAVLVRDAEQAIDLTNLLAPEHLHVACDEAEALAERLTTAGAVFLGPYSPVAIGDYAAGPSHVLPTGGTARWASGLSVNSFLRSHSVIHCTQASLAHLAKDAMAIARIEGLTAHERSLFLRGEG